MTLIVPFILLYIRLGNGLGLPSHSSANPEFALSDGSVAHEASRGSHGLAASLPSMVLGHRPLKHGPGPLNKRSGAGANSLANGQANGAANRQARTIYMSITPDPFGFDGTLQRHNAVC